MIVYCIRHGESTYNAEKRLQGQSDRPVLSALGRRQSEATARALRGKPIEALFSSPLRRAYQTAEIIAKQIGLPIRVDPRLKEIDIGIFQGELRADLEKNQPETLREWLSGRPDFALPGGESRIQLAARGREAFDAIFQSGFEQVAVVAHGGLLVSTIKSLLGIPLQNPPMALENCSITVLAHNDGGVELLALDQTEHLAEIGHGGFGDLVV